MVSYRYLLTRRRHIRAAAMSNLCRHANGFPKRGVRVNRLADVHRVCTHLNRQCNLADHVTRVRADQAAVLPSAPWPVGWWCRVNALADSVCARRLR